MGWSDISISLQGPVVEDLRFHFVQRWNFIYNEKYDVRKDVRYSRLSLGGSQQPPHGPQQPSSSSYNPQGYGSQDTQQSSSYGNANQPNRYSGQQQGDSAPYFPPPPSSGRGLDEEQEGSRGLGESRGQRHHHLERFEQEGEALKERFEGRVHQVSDQYLGNRGASSGGPPRGPMACQIVRSAAKWRFVYIDQLLEAKS